MTLYLLDENVLREMRPGGDKHVAAWIMTIDDHRFRISSITFFEKRLGYERRRRKLVALGKDVTAVDAALAGLSKFEAAYADREVVSDLSVKAELARLLGAKDKNQRDTELAAAARVHDLVLVTRNVKDFEGRNVRILNPFEEVPKIRKV